MTTFVRTAGNRTKEAVALHSGSQLCRFEVGGIGTFLPKKNASFLFGQGPDFSSPIILSYLPNPSARAGYDTRSIFKRRLTGLNSEFSFSKTSCLTKAEEPGLPCYLPIAGGRIIGFISFARVLVLREMQSVSSRSWTRVAVFISYGDNDYTTGTSPIII